MLAVVGFAALAIVAAAFVWVGSSALEGAADRLAVYYGVPAIVQGAVIAAVGSSMPELVTVVLAPVLHDDFELGLAVVIGSAIFNILVIPGMAALSKPGPLDATPTLVYKEAQFYLISVAVFLLALSLAVIYYPIDGASLEGEMTPLLGLSLVGLYGLYMFIQWADTADYEPEEPGDGIDLWRTWGKFFVGFLLILIGVEALLRAAIGIGDALGTPSFIWGVTIIAAATGFPDTFVSVRAAQEERAVTSLANVFGSNVFDLLVVVPVGVFVAGGSRVDFERLTPLLAVLILGTILLFATLRTDYELNRWEAATLLVGYFVFIAWIVLAGLRIVPGPT